MAKQYCILCQKETEYWSWSHRKWQTQDGEKEGWACGRHFRSGAHEFVPNEIKEQRREYFGSILQPYREGELSREYVERYGTKGIKATPEQVKKAKYTWKDLSGWHDRHKSR